MRARGSIKIRQYAIEIMLPIYGLLYALYNKNVGIFIIVPIA